MTGPTTEHPARTATAERRRLVTFQAAEEYFGADIFAVERVLRWEPPRLLPSVSPWLRGVIDHDGRTIPVVDLRERIGLPPAAADERSRILLVQVEGTVVGMAVDAVHAVVAVSPDAVEAPPPIYRGLAREYLEGVVRHGDRLHIVLAAGKLLTSTERIEMERVLTEGGTRG